MLRGLVYKSALIYEITMIAAYGRHYGERYRAIADLIPAGASVVDVCCGPGILYRRHLRAKRVSYLGLDINERFVRIVKSAGALGKLHDLSTADPIPQADYVVMQGSLYHFLPNAGPIVTRMLAAARSALIIAEPIRNLTDSRLRPLGWFAQTITDPGNGPAPLRFTEETLTELFSQLDLLGSRTFLVRGGRERVYILPGRAVGHSANEEVSSIKSVFGSYS